MFGIILYTDNHSLASVYKIGRLTLITRIMAN